jgi:hypothetical protein
VGCGLGVDKGVLALNTPAANVGRNVSADSFASNLHRTLGEKYLIFTDVVARTGNVTIGEDGKKSVFHYDGQYPGDVQ